ncbi:hypothetical protein D3C81_1072290 [compost metagenome]
MLLKSIGHLIQAAGPQLSVAAPCRHKCALGGGNRHRGFLGAAVGKFSQFGAIRRADTDALFGRVLPLAIDPVQCFWPG